MFFKPYLGNVKAWLGLGKIKVQTKLASPIIDTFASFVWTLNQMLCLLRHRAWAVLLLLLPLLLPLINKIN